MDTARAVVGLAATFTATAGDGRSYGPQAFACFAASGWAVPLRVDHEPTIHSGGVLPALGAWRRFALVGDGATPPGLLALGEIDPNPHGDGLLAELGRATVGPWRRSPWGLSIGGSEEIRQYAGGPVHLEVWLHEISVTSRPADPDALILGTGPRAMNLWRMLARIEPERIRAAA